MFRDSYKWLYIFTFNESKHIGDSNEPFYVFKRHVVGTQYSGGGGGDWRCKRVTYFNLYIFTHDDGDFVGIHLSSFGPSWLAVMRLRYSSQTVKISEELMSADSCTYLRRITTEIRCGYFTYRLPFCLSFRYLNAQSVILITFLLMWFIFCHVSYKCILFILDIPWCGFRWELCFVLFLPKPPDW